MKIWLPILILFLSICTLCIYDGVYTTKTFKKLKTESGEIYNSLLTESITDKNLQNRIFELNDFWTEKMDTLSVSISRKDLQPVSDYLQYLYAAVINEDQEEAITYSRLISYNLAGLHEVYGISIVNLL